MKSEPKKKQIAKKLASKSPAKKLKATQNKKVNKSNLSAPTIKSFGSRVKTKILELFSKNTKLKIVVTLVLVIVSGYLIYSNTSLSNKVIYDASKDPSSNNVKFGKNILPDPKEEDKQACRFIDLDKINQQSQLNLQTATARVITSQPEGTQTILCELKAGDRGITVLKRTLISVSEAESVYKDSKGPQFKDLDIKSGTLSYSKSQKQVIFQNDQDFYSINIVSTDDNYKKIEGVALKIPEEYLSK
jgi:hypothetical protein